MKYFQGLTRPLFYVSDVLQLVELKEAEQASLKESERLEKEIVEVQEMKVIILEVEGQY